MIEFISQPWHWSISGVMIVVVMFLLLWSGGEFGVSSNLRTLCAIGGAGKKVEFFKFDWKSHIWNLVFISGAIIGGFFAAFYLQSDLPVQISTATTEYLATIGINAPQTLAEGSGFVPTELYDTENFFTARSLIVLILGGFFVGFGTQGTPEDVHQATRSADFQTCRFLH